MMAIQFETMIVELCKMMAVQRKTVAVQYVMKGLYEELMLWTVMSLLPNL